MTGSPELPDRIPVVGTPISVVSRDQLLDLVQHRSGDEATVVAFCNVHSVMTARRNPELSAALHGCDVTSPDGMPVAWGLRASGVADQARVDGPTFMLEALRQSSERGWSHFFYGSTEPTLDRLSRAAQALSPGIQVAGTFSPPFHAPTENSIRKDTARIAESGADLVWVGLGMPKQELWMHRARAYLPGVALLGVGAAFDFLGGTTQRAPAWMQSVGLEWLHRFSQQPGRLWKRYLVNNPAYLLLLGKQIVTERYSPDRRSGRT